ncbi:MAG: Asp-tRNA(Asn)/Glu-tRNA(Gln) amidotransferase subunit GatB [Chloroflexi bacterium]|nr:Asp-tRNA(Asn)/Glu-tRNA(Gln) amidotransferase subunit GatB [Chloroflexota bacterium]
MMYEPVIGLEVHAEIATQSKIFCSCPVVDNTIAEANSAVCPVCAGMPGMLPVVNQRAVEYGIRVALALGCEIAPVSIFARKNYFYPDLPKGYQISQYKEPLAENGSLRIRTAEGVRDIRVRRVHLEEDTGKLTHMESPHPNPSPTGSEARGEGYSLIDLNRAGVPLLEIVSEPDLRSAEEARIYGETLRNLLRYLAVNSGDMQKGVLRFEANISVREAGSTEFNTRTEIKNLNSFRALERSTLYEIERQSELHRKGERVIQQTMGWDEARQVTVSQRSKEEEDDYRYFPEPDLPPLAVSGEWLAQIRADLPELPEAKRTRFIEQYQLSEYDADVLVAEQEVADYFETALAAGAKITPKLVANWIAGELFGLLNQAGVGLSSAGVSPQNLSGLLNLLEAGTINSSTAKIVLAEMFANGESAESIVEVRGLRQISDSEPIRAAIAQLLADHPAEVQQFRNGKENLVNWFFGQVMRSMKGKANPQVVREELLRQLNG